MKKHFITIAICLSLLSSCGKNTKDWPSFNVGIEVNNIMCIYMFYDNRGYFQKYEESFLKIDNKEHISETIKIFEEYKYKKNSHEIDETKDWYLAIDIVIIDIDCNNLIYNFRDFKNVGEYIKLPDGTWHEMGYFMYYFYNGRRDALL